jgi:hypothetical protein
VSDAGFVITGWVLTGGVLAAYAAHLSYRIRRARRSLPGSGGDNPR